MLWEIYIYALDKVLTLLYDAHVTVIM